MSVDNSGYLGLPLLDEEHAAAQDAGPRRRGPSVVAGGDFPLTAEPPTKRQRAAQAAGYSRYEATSRGRSESFNERAGVLGGAPNEEVGRPGELRHWLDSRACLVPLALVTVVHLAVLGVKQAGHLRHRDYVVSQVFFTLIFTAEVGARLAVMGVRRYARDAQCLFDLTVTVLDWILIAVDYWSAGIFVLRLLRIFTLLKVFRIFHRRHKSESAPALEINRDGSIIAYNPNKLFAWGFLLNPWGSVFASPEIYVQFLVLALLSTLYALNMCENDCNHAYVSAFPQVGGKRECSAWCFSPIGASNGLVFGGLVAFLLGLANSQTMSRWWNMRDKLGVVIGRSNDSALMYAAYIKGQDPESEKARKEVLRLTNLAHAAVYKQSCEDDDYSDLIEEGLISEEEWEQVRPLVSRYVMFYTWLACYLSEVADSGRMSYPQTILPMMHAEITKMRGAAADLFMYTACQLPYNYMHLMTTVVKLHLLLVSTVSGTFIGEGINENHWTDIVWGYLILLVNVCVYQGLLQVAAELANPARRTPSGFPLPEYRAFVYKCTRDAMLLPQRLPWQKMRPRAVPAQWRDSQALQDDAPYADEVAAPPASQKQE